MIREACITCADCAKFKVTDTALSDGIVKLSKTTDPNLTGLNGESSPLAILLGEILQPLTLGGYRGCEIKNLFSKKREIIISACHCAHPKRFQKRAA